MSSAFLNWRRYRARLVGGLVTPGLLALSGGGSAAEKPAAPVAAAPAPAQIQVLDLAACRRIALEQQPALAAAHNTLAAAQARCQALDRLLVPTIIEHDLPIRRRQAAFGVAIAEAEVNQAEWEALYSVTRNYYSAVYARQQQDVVDAAITNLKELKDGVQQLIKTGDRKDVTTRNLDKVNIYLQVAQGRRGDAVLGVQRALGALREAMGTGPNFCFQVADVKFPAVNPRVCRDELQDLALARRGEFAQAAGVAEVVAYEVKAQATSHRPQFKTFASASDIHSQQVPQGVRNGEYRPGALPLEMPAILVGSRNARVEQATALQARAQAVVDKTRNLIGLEVDDNYQKWLELSRKVAQLRAAADAAEKLSKETKDDFLDLMSSKIPVDDVLGAGVLATQTRIQANEAQYQQLLALIALERVTAGGFCAGLEGPTPTHP